MGAGHRRTYFTKGATVFNFTIHSSTIFPDRGRQRTTRQPMASTIRILALISLWLLITPSTSLAVDHSGEIVTDETWFAADNPHVVVGRVDINEGVTLTLEPGVEVYFNDNQRFWIEGVLAAVGTQGQEILFSLNDTPPRDWHSLYFLGDSTGTLEHFIMEYSESGIYLATNGSVSVANGTIRNNTWGIRVTNCGVLSVIDCVLQKNEHGMRARGDGTIIYHRNQIINNNDDGIYFAGATPVFGSNLTEWNDIYGNGSGEEGGDLYNHETDIDARFVYWGTMNHSQIMTQVWDWHDDHSHGYVQLLPYVNASHDEVSAVDDDQRPESSVPVAFELFQNSPNPFNPRTSIGFDLDKTDTVQLKIFDISGALVATLLDEQLPAGRHETTWRGHDDQGHSVSSGLYFYRIVTGQHTATRQMMLLK